MALSDDEIAKLYQDENFGGSFAGAKVFQHFLFTDFGEHIPLHRIYKILNGLNFYNFQVRPIRKFPRRAYDVRGYLEIVQSDLVRHENFFLNEKTLALGIMFYKEFS